MSQTPEFHEALTMFSRAFAAGDAEVFVALFADDARVLLHEQSVLVGRAAIGQTFSELFATVDTATFEVDYDIVDVHGDRAYVLATFRETLRPKDGAPAIEVDGRLVCFWHRQEGGTWRVTRVLTGRASPDRLHS
ncbi:MAG: SgcJ/EcaC family oxidoreductase [Actinomycetota bacterium]|nr:SgcJ/EcaC family oxidoreductase [Actinomycetota bacterium]